MTDIDIPTLAQLVAAKPNAARVLDRFGLDYCCHGDRTLAAACATAGVDEAVVSVRLADVDQGGDTAWTTLDPLALVDHIVATHHVPLREELRVLDALAEKVQAVHGERHPELSQVLALVAALRADLEPHLMKEERVLFPAIREVAAGRSRFPFGPISNPIRMMTVEHDHAGQLLAQLRTVTAGYTVPHDACASYRSLYTRLEELELDIHLHIHKENHVLFPAVLRMAS